jgi:hypothetical protein
MYSKPEVTKVASSLEAVQSQQQKVLNSTADQPFPLIATPHAYEADE